MTSPSIHRTRHRAVKLFSASGLLLALGLSFSISGQTAGWNAFLDGATLPEAPWLEFKDGPEEEKGETMVVDFVDPATSGTNQALRINSGTASTEWYVGALFTNEIVAAARFRLVAFSPTGKENLLCVEVGASGTHAPAPSITLVDGRFKLWSYTVGAFGSPDGGSEIMDIGLANSNEFHTAYIYGHQDGMVKLWWDGKLIYDAIAPSVDAFDGYMEWGSGSWQYDASTTIDFDWVGWGGPSDLPQHFTSTPAHGTVFQNPAAGFRFSIISQEGLSPGVAPNGVNITVNGVDRTGQLVLSGSNTNREGTLGGLQSNQVYQVNLKVTDLSGTMANYLAEFDTFSSNHFAIEAEDWNFEGGNFLDTIVLSSAPDSQNYLDRVGIDGIDQNELSPDGGNLPRQYRADPTLVNTQRTRDPLRPKFIQAQQNDPNVTDFNVTGMEVSEWLNYTRTFPSGNYNIYGRLAYGVDGADFEATMDKATNATNSNQQLTALGSFKGKGHHWQAFGYVPLTDNQGNPVVVSFSGAETLRVTLTKGGLNANYYLLVPAQSLAPRLQIDRAGDQLIISWSGTGLILESSERIGGPWTTLGGATSPFQVTPIESARFYRLRG